MVVIRSLRENKSASRILLVMVVEPKAESDHNKWQTKRMVKTITIWPVIDKQLPRTWINQWLLPINQRRALWSHLWCHRGSCSYQMVKLWLWTMNFTNQLLKSLLLSTLSPTTKSFNKMVLKMRFNLWTIRTSSTAAQEITKKTSTENQVRPIRKSSDTEFWMLSMASAKIIWLRRTNLKITMLRCRFLEGPTLYKTTWITWRAAAFTVDSAPSTKKVRWRKTKFWVALLQDCSKTYSVNPRFQKAKIW